VKSAKLLLESIESLPRHEFWPDDVSYLNVPPTGIAGYRQVTDAYLVLLAREHGGSLATMDQALAAVHAGTTVLAEAGSWLRIVIGRRLFNLCAPESSAQAKACATLRLIY